MKVLVTGGCGFIGSNFINYLLSSQPVRNLVNVDCQTYAGRGKNVEYMRLADHSRYKLVKADISDKKSLDAIFASESPDLVFNFAAESHVDRSISSSEDFVRTNVVGATNVFDASLRYGVKRVVQISTDEVYGSSTGASFREDAKFDPTSTYSSSKAAAELIGLSYFKTHGLPLVITRSANNFGPYAHPEKFIPLFITNLIDGKKVPLMWSPENRGANIRDWLHVEDNCRAIWLVSQDGKVGEAYNIPGENEQTNWEITQKLLDIFGLGDEMIELVAHRKGHDFHYSISGEKLKALGFKHVHHDLDRELKATVGWYGSNENWWRPLKK